MNDMSHEMNLQKILDTTRTKTTHPTLNNRIHATFIVASCDVVTTGMGYLPPDCAVIEFENSYLSIDLNDLACDRALYMKSGR